MKNIVQAFFLLFAVLFFFQCGNTGRSDAVQTEDNEGSVEVAPTPDAGEEIPELSVPDAGKLPANIAGHYQGILPCVDCEGIETKLFLREDSTFILLEKYSGKESVSMASFGAWRIRENRLLLDAPGESHNSFRVSAGRLGLVDEEGKETGHGLETLLSPIDMSQSFRVRGAYVYFADAANFKPCGGRKNIPVLPSKEAVELERKYLSKEREMREPMYVEVEASIKSAPGMEEGSRKEQLVVRRLVKVLDGGCG